MSRTGAQLRTALLPCLAIALATWAGASLPAAVAQSPATDFTFVPQAPVPGESVTFTATGTRGPETVRWDFESDGVFDATGTTVQHAFPTAGPRTVLMRVSRPGGDTRDVAKTVSVQSVPASVANRPPVASFTFYPREPRRGEPIEFVSTSSDAESPITSHAWDLDDDGQFDDASGVTATRAFDVAGSHTVRLRVTDASGAVGVNARAIAVSPTLASASELQLMSPFPVVRIIGRSTLEGARIKLLMVRNAPRGARVTVRCRGDGCGRRRQTRLVRSPRLRFRSFERVVGTGTRIRIFVTQRGKIGKYTSFRIRRQRPPLRRDLCVTSIRSKPRRCPA